MLNRALRVSTLGIVREKYFLFEAVGCSKNEPLVHRVASLMDDET